MLTGAFNGYKSAVESSGIFLIQIKRIISDTMKKTNCNFIVVALMLLISSALSAQTSSIDNQLDALLIQGEYNDVVTRCSEMIKSDSLNPETYYKLGLAYQNMMLTDKSIDAFLHAVKLVPDSKKYNLSLAKYYYSSGKAKLALPIFTNLCAQDSLNWVYSYYLSDIYMQKGLYENALPIYTRFYSLDTTNTLYLDKIAFCNLRMENYEKSIELYEKSLSINSKNIPALKNLSYLYYRKNMIDTAIYQLNRGIGYDSTDFDLFNRRGDIYYSQNLHYKAGADYYRVLSSGDSSKIVLKKLGIGLAYNSQSIEALKYLKAAYKKDSNDFEISSYIGQTFYNLKQYKKSIIYYNKVLKLLSTINKQTDYTYTLIADTYRDSSLYDEAIKYYNKSLSNRYSARVCMTIANLYDEKIKNFDKAISYYNLFLNSLDKNEFALGPEYIANVKKRMDWLVENKNKKKVKSSK